jgi:hypothetical protein
MKIAVIDPSGVGTVATGRIRGLDHDVVEAADAEAAAKMIESGKVNCVVAVDPDSAFIEVIGDKIPVLAISEADDYKTPQGKVRKLNGAWNPGNFRKAVAWAESLAPAIADSTVSDASASGKSDSKGSGKRGRKGTLPPDGTKMVSVNYRGVRAFGIIKGGKMVWSDKEYDSLTACSNEVTLEILDRLGIDRGGNNATTSGTRFWFAEDVPANETLRAGSHPDVRKTEGVEWQSDALADAPEGKPKRGRKSKQSDADEAGTDAD